MSLEIWTGARLSRALRKSKGFAAHPIGNGKALKVSHKVPSLYRGVRKMERYSL